MEELKHILLSRAFVCAAIVALFVSSVFFLYQEVKNHEYTTSIASVREYEKYYRDTIQSLQVYPLSEAGDLLARNQEEPVENTEEYRREIERAVLEQVQYLIGYNEWLSNILAQAERSSTFSFMRAETAFARHNIEKTASDYNRLLGIPVALGPDRVVEAFISYKGKDIVPLCIALAVCLLFAEERRKGLFYIIHSTANGRARRALGHIGILLLSSFVSVVVSYGLTYFLAVWLYGPLEGVLRPAQSIQVFKALTLKISIDQLFFLIVSMRILTIFMFSLICWATLVLLTDTKVAFVVLFALFSIEYIAYTMIPAQSTLNLWKYVNVWALLDTSKWFTQYANLNFFGYPVNMRRALFAISILVSLLNVAFCPLIYNRQYERHFSHWLEKVKDRSATLFDRFRGQMTLTTFEFYKVISLQHGWLVMLVLMLTCIHFPYVVHQFAEEDEILAEKYAVMFEGPLTEDHVSKIREEYERLETLALSSNALFVAYNEGTIDETEYYMKRMDAEDASREMGGLCRMSP